MMKQYAFEVVAEYENNVKIYYDEVVDAKNEKEAIELAGKREEEIRTTENKWAEEHGTEAPAVYHHCPVWNGKFHDVWENNGKHVAIF